MSGVRGVGPGAGPGTGAGAVGRAAQTSPAQTGASFTVTAGPASGPDQTAALSPAVALSGILALQEGESRAVRDREARKQGGKLLDELRALQLALLGGASGPAGPAALEAALSRLPEAADPALAALINQIGLRARIELARRGIAIA